MKIKSIIYILSCFSLFLISSCTEDDNYDGPNATIKGAIIDDITKLPIQTEQPNGITIRMLETKYSNPSNIDFWAKADGTFENAAMFSGEYSIVPFQGPFFPSSVAAKEVNVSGTTEVNFTVVPYLAVTATAAPSTGGVTVKFKLSRSAATGLTHGKITETRSLVSSIPTVNTTVFERINNSDKIAVRNFSNATTFPDATILATEYTDVISGLVSGKTYYVRVAARTASSTRYNYSPVMTVVVP
ncbi:MAG TPA: DUF3823 domain-containing protein [Sphingobacteriaceae bacterium]